MRSRYVWTPLALVAFLGAGPLVCQNVPGVTYADQPQGIEWAVYANVWPELQPYAADPPHHAGDGVRAALEQRAKSKDVSGGELNLLAQLEWQHGDLAAADAAIARAVALQPNHPLHAFQQAMIAFAHLRQATWSLERWLWQNRTLDAYRRTLELDPKNVSARYYLAYSYLNTPAIGGGSSAKALTLAEGGVALGQKEFYAVRADVHRVRGERALANADYDTSIAARVIKLDGLLSAAAEALKTGDRDRAKKYLDWAAYCRNDSAGPFAGLGDYYAKLNHVEAAKANYELALRKRPSADLTPQTVLFRGSVQKKLEQLTAARR